MEFLRKPPILVFLALIAVSLAVALTYSQEKQGGEKGAKVPQQTEEKKPKQKSLPEYVQEGYGPAAPEYRMDVTYEPKGHRIQGTLEVQFINNLDEALEDIHFNVWPNAKDFRSKGGRTEVSDLKVDGKSTHFDLKGTDLHIRNLSLKPEQKSSIQMTFSTWIPNQQDRFGWYGTTVSLGNWFPILAVHDKEGWNVNPYFNNGESFYSLTGDFDVNITAPRSMVIATTGTRVNQKETEGKMTTHHFQAEKVRDFAVEMDPTYLVKSRKVGDTQVNVYYRKDHKAHADALMGYGTDSLRLFNKKFGPYPWPKLDIVTMEGWFGGMEYPQLVMISISPQTENMLKMITAHEIGHQWFYGMVGNNEYVEPWLDESFASYAGYLYEGQVDSIQVGPVPNPSIHLTSPVSVYDTGRRDSAESYHRMVYLFGAQTLNELRKELGDERFYSSLRAYVEEYRFKVATTEDFIRSMEKSTGKDLSEFFRRHRVSAGR